MYQYINDFSLTSVFICIPLLLCFLVPFLLKMLNSTYSNKGGGDDSVWHIMLQGGRGWKEETIQISETYLSMIKDLVWQTKTNFPRNQGIFISIDEKHLRFWGIELFLLTWFLSTKMLIIKYNQTRFRCLFSKLVYIKIQIHISNGNNRSVKTVGIEMVYLSDIVLLPCMLHFVMPYINYKVIHIV